MRRENTSGLRGGNPGFRPLPLASRPSQDKCGYDHDNEQQFRTQLDLVIKALRLQSTDDGGDLNIALIAQVFN